MNYKQLQRQMNASLGIDVKNLYPVGKHLIREDSTGSFHVDQSQFDSLSDAICFVKQTRINIHEITSQQVSASRVVQALQEHYSGKITNTLIESIQDQIEHKKFDLSFIIESLRQDSLFETKLDFCLEDGSRVYIDRDTYKTLIEMFQSHSDIVSFMNKSATQFMKVVKTLTQSKLNG